MSDFKALLENKKSVTIHMKNLHYLEAEIYEVKMIAFLQTFFSFQENNNYNLRSRIHISLRNMRATSFETDTVSKLGAKIWSLLPEKLKSASSLQVSFLKNE